MCVGINTTAKHAQHRGEGQTPRTKHTGLTTGTAEQRRAEAKEAKAEAKEARKAEAKEARAMESERARARARIDGLRPKPP